MFLISTNRGAAIRSPAHVIFLWPTLPVDRLLLIKSFRREIPGIPRWPSPKQGSRPSDLRRLPRLDGWRSR